MLFSFTSKLSNPVWCVRMPAVAAAAVQAWASTAAELATAMAKAMVLLLV